MKIKSAKSPGLLRNILLLAILAAGVVWLAAGIQRGQKNAAKPTEGLFASDLPPAVRHFMEKPANLPELLAFFSKNTILLSVKDDAANALNQATKDEMAKLGSVGFPLLAYRNSYAAVVKNGRFAQEKRSAEGPVSIEMDSLKIESAAFDHGNFCRLEMGGLAWNADSRGLNAFVLSEKGEVMGIWTFDFFEQADPRATPKMFAGTVFHEVETIELELKESEYLKLKAKRDEALKKTILLVGEDDLVKGKLQFQGKNFKVDLRLKGDWTDHLTGDNWSFRVEMGPEDAIWGMNKFSLHRPQARNYAGEWIFHELLRDANILNLQYRFVQVHLKVEGENGVEVKNLGLYALEEFFDKYLIERGKRREGIIMKVDENPFWEERSKFISQKLDLGDVGYLENQSFLELNIVPFARGRVEQDSGLLRQFNTGAALFRDFIDGKRKISEVFDVQLLAKYNAICNLLGANHAMVSHNYRVYYNPITSRLEPVGFDANAWEKTYTFYRYLHADDDPAYLAAYAHALEEVTSDAYFNRLLAWPGLADIVSLMQKAYPDLKWSDEVLKHNRGVLLRHLSPVQTLRVHFDRMDGEQIHLTIENFGKYPVKIEGIQSKEGRFFGLPESEAVLMHNTRTSLALKLDEGYNRLFTNKKKKKGGLVAKDLSDLKLAYRIHGATKLHTEPLLPWNSETTYAAWGDDFFRETPSIQHYSHLLVVDERARTITCKPGRWRIGGPLVVPPGYVFRAGPGTQLEMVFNTSKIISYSPMEFVGSKEAPIEIISTTESGAGLAVLNPGDTSHFQYCSFTGLTNPRTSGWALTGAVNFYQAPVSLKNCLFGNNRCEDALNIFHSWFDMDDVVFSDIKADAFDGDFVHGALRNCLFGQMGNDAIDVSGSDILVENVSIVGAGDKGLSAGENSQLTARNLVIKDSEIAIASKDNSRLTISHSLLKNNALAFTAYQKKLEFGPAQIEATGLTLMGNKLDLLVEDGSSLLLNGQPAPTVPEVKGRMYGVEFGAESVR